MIWLTSYKTYAFPPFYHLMKRWYPILNGVRIKEENILKKERGQKLKETWAL